MPIDRKKKASSTARNIDNASDALGVTQLLDELRDVPVVGSVDSAFSIEDILAEFGSGKKPVYMDIPQDVPEIEPDEEKPVEKHVHAKQPAQQIEEKKPRLITDIVKPWDGGKYGDMDITATPDPKPWEKKKDVQEEKDKHDTKPRIKIRGVSSDTIPHVPASAGDDGFDAAGATRGFRIKTKQPVVDRELPGDYIKREDKRVRGQRSRSVMLFLMCLPVCYMTVATQLGWPWPGFLEYAAHPFRFVSVLCAVHLVCALLAYDVLAEGVRGIFSARPKVESAVAFSSLMCLVHTVVSLLKHGVCVQMPYSAVCCVALYFAVHGSYLKGRAWIRACKTAGATKEPVGVFVKDFYGDINVFKHSIEDRETFVGHLTSQDGADKFWSFFSGIVIAATVVFAVVACFGGGKGESFAWGLSAVSSLSVPFFATLCYAHPFSIVTKKLSDIGAALAGWYAAKEFSGELQVILRDTDVFPSGYVKLHGIKLFGDNTLEKTLSYATSLIKESGSGLYKVFAELLKSEYGRTEKISSLKFHESGGIEGMINGDRVMLGSSSFMRRCGITMVENTNVKNAVYVAINSELAGIFNMHYTVNTEVQNGFDAMKRRKMKMVLATIDFNLTPMMVEAHFGLAPGKRLRGKNNKKHRTPHAGEGSDMQVYSGNAFIYPNVENRIDLSSEDQTIDRDPCAVVARGGFAPMAFAIIAARRLRSAAVKNTVLSAVSTVFGMLLMFYLVFCGSANAAAPHNVLVYMLLWSVVAHITSLRTGDF